MSSLASHVRAGWNCQVTASLGASRLSFVGTATGVGPVKHMRAGCNC